MKGTKHPQLKALQLIILQINWNSKAIWIAPSLCNSSSADLTVVHSASLEPKYNEIPLGLMKVWVWVSTEKFYDWQWSPSIWTKLFPNKRGAPGCGLWVLFMTYFIFQEIEDACHKTAVYTKLLLHQKPFTPNSFYLGRFSSTRKQNRYGSVIDNQLAIHCLHSGATMKPNNKLCGYQKPQSTSLTLK